VLRRLLTGGLGRPPWDFPGRRSGERYVVLVRPGLTGAAAEGDPALSPEGRAQAEELAKSLASLGPLPVVSAPCRRAEETAAPLARRWGVQVSVEPAFGNSAAADASSDPGEAHDGWRRRVLGTIGALDGDTVVVVDLDVIDAVMVAATGDERGPDASPGPASRTTIRMGDGGFQLLRTGGPMAGPSGSGP
jgi:broad specificity phosphatase PhoE